MVIDEETTEDKLKQALEIYAHAMIEWTPEILLDELEFLYSTREKINSIIHYMKIEILKVLDNGDGD